MRTFHWAVVVALVASVPILGVRACKHEFSGPPPEALPHAGDWHAPPQSVVFGAPEAPAGGTLVVGVLIPSPPSRRLVDFVSPTVYADFLAMEAARGSAEPPPALLPGDAPGWEQGWEAAQRRERQRTALRAAAARVHALTRVHIVFQHLLARDVKQVPLVLVEGRIRHADDLALLAAAQAQGTWVLVGGEVRGGVGEQVPAALPERVDEIGPLVRACCAAVRAAPRVRRLPADPLEVLSARREGGDVVVALRAPVRAHLVCAHLVGARAQGEREQVVGTAEGGANGVLRLSCPDPGLDPRTHRLVASWEQDGLRLTRAWSVADLVGAVDPTLIAPRRVEAGSSFSPHVVFRNSLTGQRVAGRSEVVSLWRMVAPGAGVVAEAAGVTDAAGSLGAVLTVPDGALPGPALLRVAGHDVPVEIAAGFRLSLVTERALYRPTDTVCVRAMLHRAGNGHPVAGAEIVLRLGDTEAKVTTSAHGIASARLALVEARPGAGQVEAKCQGVAATASFRVRAFETPTFLVRVEPAELNLHTGEGVPVEVLASYVNQEPVVGAVVTVSPPAAWGQPETKATTDARGRAEVLVRAPAKAGVGTVTLVVQDADGRRQEQGVLVTARSGKDEEPAPTLDLLPLDEAVVGLPCRLEVQSDRPGPLTLVRESGAEQTVALDAAGRGVFTLVPSAAVERLDVRVGRTTLARTLAAVVRDPEVPLLLPARRLWRVGEDFTATVLGPDGPAYVDLVRDGSTLATRGVVLVGGTATVSIPLRPEGAGTVEARVWRHLDTLRGSRVSLLVVRGRPLEVKATPAAAAYEPAQTASVDVTVRDRDGRPTAAVLGYWGVDEALLALAPAVAGYEEVFDALPLRLERELAALALAVAGGGDAQAPAARALLAPVRTGLDLAPEYATRQATTDLRNAAARNAEVAALNSVLAGLRTEFLDVHRRLPLEDLRTAASLPERLRWLVGTGRLAAARLLDPWGEPLVFEPGPSRFQDPTGAEDGVLDYGWEPCTLGTGCASAGPDRCWGTDDDLLAQWRTPTLEEVGGRLARFLVLVTKQRTRTALACLSAASDMVQSDADMVCEECTETFGLCDAPFEGVQSNNLLGTGGGAGGAFAGRGGMKRSRTSGAGGSSSTPPAPVHVRKDFEPTLCFVPEAIVGPEGHTRLEIPLKDSITTWRLRLVASAPDGTTGTGQARIRVGQPLHVEPWVATHLTVGDELELPVAARNETDDSHEVALRITVSPEIQVVGAGGAGVTVGPHGTGGHAFRVRAVAPGRAKVRIDAGSATLADAVERVVVIRPRARAELETTVGTLTPEQPLTVALAAAAPGRPTDRRVTLYPTPLADVVGGFEALIACPHG